MRDIEYIGIPSPMQIGPLSFLDIYYVQGRAKLVTSEELLVNANNFNRSKTIVLGYNQPIDSFDESTFDVVDINLTGGTYTDNEAYNILYKSRY